MYVYDVVSCTQPSLFVIVREALPYDSEVPPTQLIQIEAAVGVEVGLRTQADNL
ncbi:unannotated protein [freshwater metagenome]|uniref:Unannotated protein n=1 Tax=freshwater metagenome TaxID=449393 RepID=A0A6J7DQ52_9ZZZZ